jgi:hypothetical protein
VMTRAGALYHVVVRVEKIVELGVEQGGGLYLVQVDRLDGLELACHERHLYRIHTHTHTHTVNPSPLRW